MRAAKRRNEKNARTHARTRAPDAPSSQGTAARPSEKSGNYLTEHSGCLLSAQRKKNAPCRRTKSARAEVSPRELENFKRPGSLGCCCCSGDYNGPACHVARGSTAALTQKKSCGGASGAAKEHSLRLDPPRPRQHASYRPLPLSRRSRRHPAAAEPKSAKIPRRAQWFAAIEVCGVTPAPV